MLDKYEKKVMKLLSICILKLKVKVLRILSKAKWGTTIDIKKLIDINKLEARSDNDNLYITENTKHLLSVTRECQWIWLFKML